MNYQAFREGIWAYEEANWFGEIVYYAAINRFNSFRAGKKLFTERDVQDVIHLFLVQWGQMARWVNRKDTNWKGLWRALDEAAPQILALSAETILMLTSQSMRRRYGSCI